MDTHQLLAVLLQLLAAGLSEACLQALVLQVLLDFLKLLPADSPLLQLADSPSPLSQLYLHHAACFNGWGQGRRVVGEKEGN